MRRIGLELILVAVLLLLSGCIWGLDPETGTIHVVDAGADPTGKRDCTALLQRLHATGKTMFYPNGTYRFNGESLDLSGGVIVESQDGVTIRNDLSDKSVVVFDDQGKLIGLQHNHLERDEQELGGRKPITCGSLVRPPLVSPPTRTRMDLLAHWYNDFGLERTRANPGAGWIGWYTWSWNHHDTSRGTYDPARHPLLGFYRGDDPVVLDWQCYWLASYGVAGVILPLSPVGLDEWEQPANRNHWIYELFHDVPNFSRLRYVIWGYSPWLKSTAENRAKVEEGWRQLIEATYLTHRNGYVVEHDGGRYPLMFVWEEGALRGVFDNYRGSRETAAFYGRVAEMFRRAGYDGVALLARHGVSDRLMDRETLARRGVLHFDGFYATSHGQGDTYAERLASYSPPVGPDTVVNTVTAMHSHPPHPGMWDCPGHRPELFRRMLEKAMAHIEAHDLPRIVTCYNVAEWAEGGPGLQPNMQDRFGYLEAVRDALVIDPDCLRTDR